jgi:hypothetical protein
VEILSNTQNEHPKAKVKDPQHFLFVKARINGHQSLLSASASRLIVSTVFFPTHPIGELLLDTMLIDHTEKN